MFLVNLFTFSACNAAVSSTHHRLIPQQCKVSPFGASKVDPSAASKVDDTPAARKVDPAAGKVETPK